MHYKKSAGMTEEQHLDIFAEVKELMWADPMILLPKHYHLLKNDIGHLGQCTYVKRSNWITLVESALSAAERVYSGKQSWSSFQAFRADKS